MYHTLKISSVSKGNSKLSQKGTASSAIPERLYLHYFTFHLITFLNKPFGFLFYFFVFTVFDDSHKTCFGRKLADCNITIDNFFMPSFLDLFSYTLSIHFTWRMVILDQSSGNRFIFAWNFWKRIITNIAKISLYYCIVKFQWTMSEVKQKLDRIGKNKSPRIIAEVFNKQCCCQM